MNHQIGTIADRRPLVSVIVTVYNCDRYIAQAIESILDQTYTNYEIIVVDDGSTDRTYSVLQPYLDSMQYIYQENQGASAAWNRGIRIARGEFIAFLDHDDFFLPDKIADQVACFQSQPSLGIVHAGWRMVNERGEAICDSTPWHNAPNLDLETWLLHNPTLPSAMMFRRSWLIQANGFDLRFPTSADTHLVFRLLLMGCSATWLKKVVVCYRTHANNISKDFTNHAKASCAVREDFFARSDLPANIRQLEKPVRFQHYTHHAWRLYNAGYYREMSQYLRKSLEVTPYPLEETIPNWIQLFAERSSNKDFNRTQSLLEGIEEWHNLIHFVREMDNQNRSIYVCNTERSMQTTAIPNLAFITCIEKGVLEAQSLLLYESIRRNGGAFSQCPIYAISPRAGHTVSSETRRCLEKLSVEYIDMPLTAEFDYYPQSNRTFASSYIEAKKQHDILVLLDSDTLFLREPSQLWLPEDIDVRARPVGLKGICTSGPLDEFEPYWQRLCQFCNVSYDRLPTIETSIDRIAIKACYNGGLVAVRASKGIFNQWLEYFVGSMKQELFPRSQDISVRTGTGLLPKKGGRVFNSQQSTLALAIWRLTERVQHFTPDYNYQLNVLTQVASGFKPNTSQDLIHIHYHWMFNSEHLESNLLFQSDFYLEPDLRNWLIDKLPLDQNLRQLQDAILQPSADKLHKVRLDLERSRSRLEQIKLDLEQLKLR